MANTLTSLIPDLYRSLDVVVREQVGFIPAVTIDASVNRAAVGQNVRSFKTRAANVGNTTPAMVVPEPTAQTVDNEPIIITKSRTAEFGWEGEETLGVDNNGPGAAAIKNDQMLQAIRALTNEVEADLAQEARVSASRAYGTAGTAPFASDLSDPAQVRKILADNGMWISDMQLVINSTAGAKLRTLAQLTKANEAGTVQLREQGLLLDIHNFKIRESAAIASVAKGTGTGYTIDTTDYPVGATSIALISGTGTILAGDVVTFAGDTNKYVVATGIAAPGTIVLAAPGLRQALTTDTAAVTVGADYSANSAFSRSSIILAARAPALPAEGDSAADRKMIVDPRSGLAFEVALYKGYRKNRYELSLAWGVAGIKSQGIATLLG